MGANRSADHVVDALSSYQQESGLVTRREIGVARAWLEAVGAEGGNTSSPGGWLDGWLGTELPFSFRYRGEESSQLLRHWQRTEARATTGDTSDRRAVTWDDPASGLRLKWQIRAFRDYPAVEWLLTFENAGSGDTSAVEDVQALDLRLRTDRTDEPYVVHGANGGRSLPDDMMPLTWQLSPLRREPSYSAEIELGGDFPSSNRHLPFFNLETPDGRGVMVGIGWSGNWQARVTADGAELRARAGKTGARYVLHPGEKVRTPRILLVFWQGRRLHGHNVLRQLLRRHYVPTLRGQPQQPLVSVNVCFTHHGFGGFLHEATEGPVLSLVKPFADLGAEVFIVDAGWYDGAPWHEWQGNWRYSRAKYPHGLRPISEPLMAAGVAFGLWFASEEANGHAPVLAEHPEWFRPRPDGSMGYLRMDLPEAREWFLSQVDNLARDELMTCFRQDGVARFGVQAASDPGGVVESHHLAGLYAVWDAIAARHPGIVMEGCCGGGRRIDLETVSRFHWHQKSDRWYDTESDQCSLYGASLFLPGGMINIPTEGVDDYTAWSSFAGQLCLGWHPLDADFPMELARRQVERYKRVRPLLTGDFYPLTPCSLADPWIGYQFHRADLDRGFALVFRRFGAERAVHPVGDTFTACLRGLNPDARYLLHFERTGEERVLSGAALAEGVELVIAERKGAELIEYGRAAL